MVSTLLATCDNEGFNFNRMLNRVAGGKEKRLKQDCGPKDIMDSQDMGARGVSNVSDGA